ncbi:MAG: septum formation protein Maf [Candidatus Omnitrophica bacterium]|nr:septum formation protein Maf [Candidatus Omnitrophota bacterium]
MNIIYLASKSKARAELLEKLGFKFKVMPSKIKEKRSPGKLSYARLVKANALSKAMDVANKINSGVVIAADTICVQDGKIFGKPKDIKGAKRMLKKLSAKPQWLYSGVAVIDKCAGRKKVMVDCEKTKVYMDKLGDKEIDAYFKRVSPLGKAGSFDIQGRGALFIRRIEGCFYNVVGLPLRKLFLMLKKTGINKFLVFLAVIFLTGCSHEYNIVTGKQEAFYYSTDKEVQMGQSIAKQVEKAYKEKDTVDPLMQKRVEDIGKKIAAVSDRQDIDYYFAVLDDDEINAFALPGGYVYINKGLVEKVDNDDELACVLAHEVGHIVARHSIKKLQAMQTYSILKMLVAAAPSSGEVGTASDAAFTEILLGYSREDELLADQLGARYTKLAGYNPSAMISFLKKLQEVNKRRPLAPKSYFKTHPYVPDRVRVVKEEMGEGISFSDYINIEQLPHKSY